MIFRKTKRKIVTCECLISSLLASLCLCYGYCSVMLLLPDHLPVRKMRSGRRAAVSLTMSWKIQKSTVASLSMSISSYVARRRVAVLSGMSFHSDSLIQ